MANLTITNAPGSYPTAGVACTLNTPSAGGDAFDATGRELFIYWNQSTTTAHDITVNGVADEFGRDITITQEVAAESFVFAGPFTKTAGWVTASGQIEVLSDTPADGKMIVIRMPNE
jgi:hypothetical protein